MSLVTCQIYLKSNGNGKDAAIYTAIAIAVVGIKDQCSNGKPDGQINCKTLRKTTLKIS